MQQRSLPSELLASCTVLSVVAVNCDVLAALQAIAERGRQRLLFFHRSKEAQKVERPRHEEAESVCRKEAKAPTEGQPEGTTASQRDGAGSDAGCGECTAIRPLTETALPTGHANSGITSTRQSTRGNPPVGPCDLPFKPLASFRTWNWWWALAAIILGISTGLARWSTGQARICCF